MSILCAILMTWAREIATTANNNIVTIIFSFLLICYPKCYPLCLLDVAKIQTETCARKQYIQNLHNGLPFLIQVKILSLKLNILNLLAHCAIK